MLNALFKRRSAPLVVFVQRPMTIKSDADLNIQMKLFNDKKQFKKTLELFDEHKEKYIGTLSSFTITQALKACTQIGDLQRGSTIHRHISSRLSNDHYILASLIHLYMQCSDVARAESLFGMSKKKTEAMYGAMMKGYIKNKMANKAIDLFNEIQNPDEIITNLLFNACAQLENIESLNLVKQVLKKMPKSFHSNSLISTSLLDALMKCGDVTYAELLFNKSTKKSLNMYGAMMKGYVDNNLPEKAIDLFNEIENPDDVNMIILFNACAQLKTKEALDLVKKISKHIPKSFYSNPRILTSLLDALMKCGDVAHAESLFYSAKEKDLPSYGAMMKGYVENDLAQKTIELFDELKNPADMNKILLNHMKLDDIQSSIPIYLSAIKAVSQIGDYSKGQSIVKQIPNSLLVEYKIRTALIDLWGKVGSVDEAKLIFDKIRQPNHIEYTTMVNSYGLNGMGMQAIALFHQIPREFLHEATYVCALNACSHSGLVGEARLIFKNIEMKTVRIYSTMIDCLSRASAFEQAQELIDEYERNHSPESTMYS
ncbi:unnamed protein product [Rotaria socialis]|uniref:Pentatricopeptide repeat-containing protein n=1 Tax=Rotaria socialis TaxID=392032 RepID=A0A818S626_9BILA|nr:unnamed protein product [Rotaria socialis]CAF4803906.1 unnamed protein product [Rotaria socialis]